MQDTQERLKEILSKKPDEVTQEELLFVFDNINWSNLVNQVSEEINKEIIE
jgi:hypothetical protein